jgi:mono/diheme cytochrome c family protein
VTEVPDHLLQRSLERRAALGGTSAPAAAPSGGGGDDGGGASTAAAVPAEAAAPAVVEYVPPPPPPPYVQAALDRKKIPRWMAGVGAVTILWAFIYAGVLFAPAATITDPVVAQGQDIFAARCASCHGASGEGGTGRPLADSVTDTFPDIADHIAFVHKGSFPEGTPYGNPDRPGGQHIARSQGFGQMPAWEGVLTDDEIIAVVRYEREVLDDEEPSGDASASPSTTKAP